LQNLIGLFRRALIAKPIRSEARISSLARPYRFIPPGFDSKIYKVCNRDKQR